MFFFRQTVAAACNQRKTRNRNGLSYFSMLVVMYSVHFIEIGSSFPVDLWAGEGEAQLSQHTSWPDGRLS